MLSVLIQTLGCKLNQLESEAITSAFLRCGFVLTDGSCTPSLIVINTCTVTSKADQKARRVIRKALRDYPDACVIVTGCYAQLNQTDLYKLDTNRGGRLFVFKGMEKMSVLELPNYLNKKKDIAGALKRLRESEKAAGSEQKNGEGLIGAFQFSPERFSNHTRSFLKIQDGCDKHCTYCRIRLARGPCVSLDADEVLARLRILEKSHSEAVLTGVNISQYYDKTRDVNLAALLEHLLCGTEKIALRLSSLAPDSIDENFTAVISHKRIRAHFHLSIQSGSKKTLEKMGRSYNAQTVEKAASLLRSAKVDPFLACDIITGFPGETNADFEETFELCKKTDFAWIHVFPYSKRPGTPACSFPGTVRESEITKRVQILTNLARQGRADYVRRWLGREVDVLVEKGNPCRGVSDNYLKLLVKYKGEKAPVPGSVLRCKIVEEEFHAEARSFTEDTEGYDAVAEEV
jgi:threonylcarbamoyladenosine tRNA methylthiotransferase MtaB